MAAMDTADVADPGSTRLVLQRRQPAREVRVRAPCHAATLQAAAAAMAIYAMRCMCQWCCGVMHCSMWRLLVSAQAELRQLAPIGWRLSNLRQ